MNFETGSLDIETLDEEIFIPKENKSKEKKAPSKKKVKADSPIKDFFWGIDGTTASKRLSGIPLLAQSILDYFNRNKSMDGPQRSYNFYGDSIALYSGRMKVTFLYIIDGYPASMRTDFREALRDEAHGEVRISFLTTYDRYNLDYSDNRVKSQLRTWANSSQQTEEESYDTTAFNIHDKAADMRLDEWRRASMIYYNSAKERKVTLYTTRTLMLVSGVRGDTFDKTCIDVEERLKGWDITYSRITSNLSDYLGFFSPFSAQMEWEKNLGNPVLSDEIIATFNTCTQGKVGTRGVYFGTDVYSKFPVFKTFKKRDTDAENLLIVGETGSGKSYFAKAIFMFLLSDSRFVGTIMDIEGFEYKGIAGFLANTVDVVYLNMGEGQGKYFDPVEVNLTGIAEIDEGAWQSSVSNTLSLLKVLVGDFVDKDEWAIQILNKGVSRAYTNRGVSEDPDTWENSFGMTLKDIYQAIKDDYAEGIEYIDQVKSGKRKSTVEINYMLDSTYEHSLNVVLGRLSVYFEPPEKGGTRSGLFKERVTRKEISDAKLVVCSFGLAMKTEGQIDNTQFALTQCYAGMIANLRSVYAKARKKYNFKVWEEYQRWGTMTGSREIVNAAITGERKMGGVNFILSNKAGDLLNNAGEGLFQNVTSFIIGSIPDSEIRKDICKRLSIMELIPDLDKLVIKHTLKGSVGQEKEGSSNNFNSPYEKAFLIKLDGQTPTITRMQLPDGIAGSVLFKTGLEAQ